MAKILVIDDEQIIRDSLKERLDLDDHETFTAENSEKGLESFQKEQPDIVILDIRMPGMDGIDVLKIIKKESKEIEVIMITGHGGIDTAIEAMKEGAFGYIQKPIEFEELDIEIKNALEKQNMKNIVKSQQQQLIQAEKMASLGTIAAGITHEINNPLSFIYSNLENLKDFFKDIIELIESYDQMDVPENTKSMVEKKKEEINYSYLKTRIIEMIDISVAGADRMKQIIMDMKTFSRLDAAKVEDADINNAIDTTLNLLVHEYKNRIEIKKEYGAIPLIKCNIAKLNQVFMNLLVNSCHAIKERGEIKIKTCMENKMVKIEISDTGAGIPDDVINQIFNPFFTTKVVGKGTGLGLSISHGIIEQHKGEISVKSKGGEGTTFIIKIPVDQKIEDLDK